MSIQFVDFTGPPGMRRFPPGPGRGFGREGPDDYDEELRAFSRKREREKRRRQDTTSESADSGSEEGDSHKKRKSSKGRDKGKKSAKKTKKNLSDEGRVEVYVNILCMQIISPFPNRLLLTIFLSINTNTSYIVTQTIFYVCMLRRNCK